MSGGGETVSASGSGSLPVCHQCGTVYQKHSAKFCSRCGAPRDSVGSAVNSKSTAKAPPKRKKSANGGDGGGAAVSETTGAAATKSNPRTPSSMPQLTAASTATTLDNGKGTLRPFDVEQLQQQQQRLLNGVTPPPGATTPLEFRDPGTAASLTSPKHRSNGDASSPPAASAAAASKLNGQTKASIYAKDNKLPELPPASLADPRRYTRNHSESSEETSARGAAGASGAAAKNGASSSNNSAGASPGLVPMPPREQQTGRPTSASGGAAHGRRHSATYEHAVEDRFAYTDGGPVPSKRKRKTSVVASQHSTDDEEEETTKSLHPSAEEEAQYTAWATLPPDGLTPEMLQTSNASELRKWRKGSLIGRGTYGSVYLGLLPDGSFYAVKCVELSNKKAAADHLGVLELVSLSREINMMHRLRHRNLCTFKGVYYDTEDTSICMFMEYIGGGSLSSLVKRFKPLPPSVVRSWTQQLLSGLQYLHAQHIIHRDVKGDNVLVDTSADPASMSQIKLVDFGAARRLTDAVSQSSTVIGTPYWMAPEVVDASGEGSGYSYKADVWSVGCTVAEMLTGRPPWPCKTSAPAAIMMIASATGMPTEIPEEEATPGCLDFMKQCFIRDPGQRPTVQKLLQHPWIKGSMS